MNQNASANKRNQTVDRLIKKLSVLEGLWKGEGMGKYPTIDSFRYEETLFFEVNMAYPLLYYTQKTVLLPSQEEGHWESGFIRPLEDGFVEISNSQEGGRVEVLRGKIETGAPLENTLHLLVDSIALGNDPRLVKTRREFDVNGEILRYKKYMSTNTTKTPQLQLHLDATLKRIVSDT